MEFAIGTDVFASPALSCLLTSGTRGRRLVRPVNISIHGITPEMVADAPRWNLVLPALVDYIGDDVVVARNAGFDIGVIWYACAADNIE